LLGTEKNAYLHPPLTIATGCLPWFFATDQDVPSRNIEVAHPF